jgi:hypothetical protein
MFCKLKSFALLATALLALSGSATSTAAAANFTSTSGATLKGVQDGPYSITATGVTMECGIVELEGTVPSGSFEKVTLTPTITECIAFGFAEGKLTGFGHYGEKEPCHLVLYANGTGDLVCPPGKEVVLEASNCTVRMPSQSGVKTFTFTKIKHEGVDALTVGFNINNLRGSHTDGFLCPFQGGGSFENTKASGAGMLSAKAGGNPVGITWDE